VLFLEDLDEYIYHIDRMMVGLRRAGVLDGIVGLVVGGFTDIHDHAVPFGREVMEVILEQFDEIPVGCGFPMGHIDGNEAFVVGCTVELVVEKNAAVAFLVG
jgi:muramoyltetrapeptide carboxypeptidase